MLRRAWIPAIAGIYFLTAKLGLRLAFLHESATAVWPPTGIAIAALLLLGLRAWPGVFAGAFLANITTAGSVPVCLGIASGNTLEGVLGAWLIGRFARGGSAFDSARGVFLFALLGGALAPVVSATLGVGSLTLGGLAPLAKFGAIWLTWWLGDCAGALLVAPLVVLWSKASRIRWTTGRAAEGMALVSVLVLSGVAIFTDLLPSGSWSPSLMFLCLPPLLWAAFRFDTRAVATAVIVLAGPAIAGTLGHRGPFAGEDTNVSLLLLQAFLCVVSVTLLALSAAIEEQVRATAALEAELAERKRLEERLVHAQKMEAIALLAGGIAHDFNNLLNAILGYADFALRSLPPGAQAREDVGEVRKAAVRGVAITRQLLAFGRRQPSESRVIDLSRLVTQMKEMLRRLIGENLRVETSLEPSGATILGDRAQLEVVIMNLAINARDAMPNGGMLRIETTVRDLGQEALLPGFEVRPGRYVELTVSDTGCGMEADVLARAFEPFFTTKDRARGTGLGLPSVFGIVKHAGGQIAAASRPGQGSRFVIHFPRAEGPSLTPVGASVREASGTSMGSILLVEDDPILLRLAERILQGEGYEVVPAADGQRAMQALDRRTGGFDLLLTDIVMPGMSGLELAERVRAARPEVAVLLMSGHAFEDVSGHRGMDGVPFLQKPFTPEGLVERVRELLPRRS